jgi:hypothetical protein
MITKMHDLKNFVAANSKRFTQIDQKKPSKLGVVAG